MDDLPFLDCSLHHVIGGDEDDSPSSITTTLFPFHFLHFSPPQTAINFFPIATTPLYKLTHRAIQAERKQSSRGREIGARPREKLITIAAMTKVILIVFLRGMEGIDDVLRFP